MLNSFSHPGQYLWVQALARRERDLGAALMSAMAEVSRLGSAAAVASGDGDEARDGAKQELQTPQTRLDELKLQVAPVHPLNDAALKCIRTTTVPSSPPFAVK